jgi:16S rRNA processing protein RimM
MISFEDVFPVGQIFKPHGVNGEMSFSFTSDVFSLEKELDFFVLEVDGILTPFYISGYRLKTEETGLLQLDGIDSEASARELSGKKIYLLRSYVNKIDSEEIELDYFTGFQLKDRESGFSGTISEIDDSTENTLFVIEKDDGELLIPVSEDYIISIDHDKRILVVDLPQGLLNL